MSDDATRALGVFSVARLCRYTARALEVAADDLAGIGEPDAAGEVRDAALVLLDVAGQLLERIT